MKRKTLAVAAAILAIFAIAGTAFATNPAGNGHNPFHYGDQFYGSSYQREEPVAEPGTTNNHTWQKYNRTVDPNQVVP